MLNSCSANKILISLQVIPEFKPLKTELKVDTCVLAPYGDKTKISGRIHEVKANSYVIEYLVDVIKNERKMAHIKYHKLSELVVIYSAWCSKCWIRICLRLFDSSAIYLKIFQ